jgi:agmatine deiminase
VDRIVLIPDDPLDFTGHADGMVSAYTNDTVLLNDYRNSDPELGIRVRRALREAGLRHELVPYAPQGGTALGCYINFLRHIQGVVVPLYGLPEDEQALRRFAELFPWHEVRGLDCRAIAQQGGSLHCITWATLPEWCQPNPRIPPKPDTNHR